MKNIKVLFLSTLMICGICTSAQISDSLMQEIKSMTKEKDPGESLGMMNTIIKKYKLKESKDAEIIDMMKGIVAVNYLEAGKNKEFDKMISSIPNKFNQTSYMSMGAATLLEEGKNLKRAESLAKAALDLYLSIKDDPKAKPANYPEEDWKRFMKFAYYPYCDTYASALFAVKKYKEALTYQEIAFNGTPEDGFPPSVERYANLLIYNSQSEKAYPFLLEMAKIGKSTDGMNKLLKELYAIEEGDGAGFDEFFADLQKNVVKALKEKFKKKMQDIEAPVFSLKDLEGKTVSLPDFKGQVVVLDFWATWCVPCKASFPAMKKVMQRHPEVKFLFIDTQEKQDGALEKVKNYIKQNQYDFHVLMDTPMQDNVQQFQVMSLYKVEGIPTKIVIDAKGKQRFFSVGFTSDTELINEMEAMLQLAKD